MDYRDRIIRTIHFKDVDELPFRHAYGLMPGVLEDWHAQGLPVEVQAGNDITAYRRRFGKRLAYDGGLEKQTLTRDTDAIENMLGNTIPYMKATGGGWTVCLDHRVVRGTPLKNFRFYVDHVRQMIKM